MATASLDATPVATRTGLPCDCGTHTRVEVDIDVVWLHPSGVHTVRYTGSECACGHFEVTR